VDIKEGQAKNKEDVEKKKRNKELLCDNDFLKARLNNWMDMRVIKRYSNKSLISL